MRPSRSESLRYTAERACSERQDLEAADAYAAAEAARLRARGYPRPALCLRCDRAITADSPARRLCEPCRRLNAETEDLFAVPARTRTPSADRGD